MRIAPETWLQPEVYRRIIAEASAEDNLRIVRYATGNRAICLVPKGLIETIPITLLILCHREAIRVSFPLQRRLGIQYMERSGSLAHRSCSVVH